MGKNIKNEMGTLFTAMLLLSMVLVLAVSVKQNQGQGDVEIQSIQVNGSYLIFDKSQSTVDKAFENFILGTPPVDKDSLYIRTHACIFGIF